MVINSVFVQAFHSKPHIWTLWRCWKGNSGDHQSHWDTSSGNLECLYKLLTIHQVNVKAFQTRPKWRTDQESNASIEPLVRLNTNPTWTFLYLKTTFLPRFPASWHRELLINQPHQVQYSSNNSLKTTDKWVKRYETIWGCVPTDMHRD